MKKIFILIGALLLTSGCSLAKDTMENITIYTTSYPIEYLTNELYGENSTILSIYPNEIIKLSDKLITDYSRGDLFVYNGLSDEKNYAVEMLNKNRRLMIVDAAMGMEYSNGIEELWLNPANFLMLSQNISNGMKEYITNTYLKNLIDENYESLKVKISEIDAEFKLVIENSDKTGILVADDALKFLEKYNLNVISLSDKNLTDRKLLDAKNLIDENKTKYIILIKDVELDKRVEDLLKEKEIEKLFLNPLTTISEESELNDENYISIMYKNIESLKKELYE